MKQPFISIIIPVYNAQEYICDTITSILMQNYHAIEIILVNDGSQDRSKEIIENMMQEDSRIVLINQTNQGVSSARNAGIKNASGEYLMFVDSDDFLKADILESMIKAMPSDCSMMFGGYAMVKESENTRKTVQEFVPYKEEKVSKTNFKDIYDVYYKNKIFLSIWGKLYRTDIIKQHNIEFQSDFTIGEDMLFIQDILDLNYPIYAYPKVIYEYMLSTSNSITKTGCISRIMNAERLFEKSINFGSRLQLEKEKMEIFPNYFLRTCFVTLENSAKEERRELAKELLLNKKLTRILNDFKFNYTEDKVYSFILKSRSYFLINSFTMVRKILKRFVK